MRVRITRQAWRDLDAIGDWIAGDDRQAAVALTVKLARRAQAIGQRPLSFPQARGEYRKRSVHPYVILFRLVPGEVEVVRIVHGRRDYLSLLEPE